MSGNAKINKYKSLVKASRDMTKTMKQKPVTPSEARKPVSEQTLAVGLTCRIKKPKCCVRCDAKIIGSKNGNDQMKHELLLFTLKHLLELPEHRLYNGWNTKKSVETSPAYQKLELCESCCEQVQIARKAHQQMIDSFNTIKRIQKQTVVMMKQTTKKKQRNGVNDPAESDIGGNVGIYVKFHEYKDSLLLTFENYEDDKEVKEDGPLEVDTNLENGGGEEVANVRNAASQSGHGFMDNDFNDMEVDFLNLANQQAPGSSTDTNNANNDGNRPKRPQTPNRQYPEWLWNLK